MFQDQVIPAVTSIRLFEEFLKTNYEYCVLMNLHLGVLKRVVEKAHQAEKKCLLHIDLINGLMSNEFGAEYAIQTLKVDGVVSTKGAVVKVAKKKKVIAVYRVFLIDNHSLNRSIDRVNELKPDFVEILPAIANKVITRVKDRIAVPIIGGGLISTKEDIRECFDAGMVGITTSDIKLW